MESQYQSLCAKGCKTIEKIGFWGPGIIHGTIPPQTITTIKCKCGKIIYEEIYNNRTKYKYISIPSSHNEKKLILYNHYKHD